MSELTNKQEWKIKGIELGYVLGLSLLLAGIIYFFASNWPGFEKWTKIGLSVGLLLLFYGCSFILNYLIKRHPSLSQLFLLFGCLSFGVGVALLGQIYNSHADSYMLFVVWAIPALLFSLLTKSQPFYVLSYILIHLGIFFYLFPSSSFLHFPDTLVQWIFLGIAIMNGLLFFVTERGIFKSGALKFLSFIVMNGIMLSLTIEEFLDPFNMFVSLLYIAVLGFFYKYFLMNQVHKSLFIVLGPASIGFIVIKFIEFVIFTNTEFIFLFTFVIPFLLVGFAIYGLRKWKQKSSGGDHAFIKKVIVGITTVVASIIAGSSIYGIVVLFTSDMPFTFFVLFSIALIFLAKFKQNWDGIITYTLLFTALFIAIPATLDSNVWLNLLYCASLLYTFFSFKQPVIRYVTYLSILIVVINSLFEVVNYSFTKEFVFGVILLINIVVYVASTRMAQSVCQQIIQNNSLVYGLLSFFILTFFFEDQVIVYYIVNGLYFVITTVLLTKALKRNDTLHYWLFLIFWFAYIVYKYYDLVWSLLHKSVTFFITGFLLLLIVQRLDRKLNYSNSNFVKLKIVPIIIVILVQLGLLGVQVGKSESLLAGGEMIKLELAPVDPRSLLQGDYLTLSYTISSLEIEEEGWNERVKIGLNKNDNGVYEYSGHYVIEKVIPEKLKQQADVWITGTFKGYQMIEYGIENYFVPEGTGWDLQEKVKYAYVKVAANGDAILVELPEN